MLNLIKNFAKDESGAVTVDWVVLTAAIVGLGILVLNTVGQSTTGLASEIGTSLDNVNPSTTSLSLTGS